MPYRRDFIYESINKMLIANDGMITAQEVVEEGIHSQYLTCMAKSGSIHRVSRGVYSKTDIAADWLYNAQYGRSLGILSHESALHIHRLCSKVPLNVHMTFPSGYNARHLDSDHFTIFYVGKEKHSLGQVTRNTRLGRPVRCYDPERTLVDILRSRNRIDTDLIETAYRKYLSQSPSPDRLEVKPDLLMNYAEVFKVRNVLQRFLKSHDLSLE